MGLMDNDDEIKKAIETVLRSTQLNCDKIELQGLDKIFRRFKKAKQYFINDVFNGQYIVEYPDIKFSLSEYELAAIYDDCIKDLYFNCVREYESLSSNPFFPFIKAQSMNSFFCNTVDIVTDEFQNYKNSIKPGMKLSKSLKYFIEEPELLQKVQMIMSSYIQQATIEGTLCISVHPLDFLSSSENNHKWRSCHSLDGAYRAGNFSYMLDTNTCICYIKSNKEDEEISGFHTSEVKWNNKKWRMLLHINDARNLMFTGRQYPFVIPGIEDQILVRLKHLMPNGLEWTSTFEDISTNEIDGFSLRQRYYPTSKGSLIGADELLVQGENALNYDDLKFSGYYNPKYAFVQPYYGGERGVIYNPFDSNEELSLCVGHKVVCAGCGQVTISSPCRFVCKECEKANRLLHAEGFAHQMEKAIPINNIEYPPLVFHRTGIPEQPSVEITNSNQTMFLINQDNEIRFLPCINDDEVVGLTEEEQSCILTDLIENLNAYSTVENLFLLEPKVFEIEFTGETGNQAAIIKFRPSAFEGSIDTYDNLLELPKYIWDCVKFITNNAINNWNELLEFNAEDNDEIYYAEGNHSHEIYYAKTVNLMTAISFILSIYKVNELYISETIATSLMNNLLIPPFQLNYLHENHPARCKLNELADRFYELGRVAATGEVEVNTFVDNIKRIMGQVNSRTRDNRRRINDDDIRAISLTLNQSTTPIPFEITSSVLFYLKDWQRNNWEDYSDFCSFWRYTNDAELHDLLRQSYETQIRRLQRTNDNRLNDLRDIGIEIHTPSYNRNETTINREIVDFEDIVNTLRNNDIELEVINRNAVNTTTAPRDAVNNSTNTGNEFWEPPTTIRNVPQIDPDFVRYINSFPETTTDFMVALDTAIHDAMVNGTRPPEREEG